MNPYYNMRPWAKFLIDHNMKFIIYLLFFTVQIPLSLGVWFITTFPKSLFGIFSEFVKEVKQICNGLKLATKPVKEKE